MTTRKILIALPDQDFDVTEVAIPWKHFLNRGHQVTFATEQGKPATADPLLISGVLFGQLGAKPDALAAYREMEKSPAFQNPIRFEAIDPKQFDALHLPGGHAPGMRPYLESQVLREKTGAFFQAQKPIGAICHGVLVLARTPQPVKSGPARSILHGKHVTALTKFLERSAYYLTAWKHGRYYRTYPEYVQDEVTRHLRYPQDFETGKSPWHPFVVRDGKILTARWPRDAHLYAEEFTRFIQTH